MSDDPQQRPPTIRRLMVRIAAIATLLAPVGWVIGLMRNGNWSGFCFSFSLYCIIGFVWLVYRDFKNPFG